MSEQVSKTEDILFSSNNALSPSVCYRTAHPYISLWPVIRSEPSVTCIDDLDVKGVIGAPPPYTFLFIELYGTVGLCCPRSSEAFATSHMWRRDRVASYYLRPHPSQPSPWTHHHASFDSSDSNRRRDVIERDTHIAKAAVKKSQRLLLLTGAGFSKIRISFSFTVQ